MIFARAPGDAGGTLHRPVLLMLTEDHAPGPAGAAAAEAALAAGFRAVLVPWFALAPGIAAPTATAGHEALPGGNRRAIAAPEDMRPDAMLCLARPAALGRAGRLAAAGFLNTSCAATIAPLLDPAEAPDGPALRGILSFAPDHARPVPPCAEAGALATLCETLAAGHALPALLAAGDPRRVLLPLRAADGSARFDFLDGADGIDAGLLTAWLDAARARCAPPLPLLLPAPATGRAAPASGGPIDPARPAPPPALADVLPSPAAGHLMVRTSERADATFDFLSPDLAGPGFADAPRAPRAAALKRHAIRSIVPDGVDEPHGRRLVEPGVGRAVLIDRLSVKGRPELRDFTAVGVGRTPYSEGGFVDVGRAIDGLAALCRARHRRACAERLEAGGCRAAPVLAIATLHDDWIDVPGIGRLQAAIAVRGFRCVLRVKQLDPIAGFYHSVQYAPLAHDFLMHPQWNAIVPAPDAQGMLMALEAYAAGSSLAGLAAPPPTADAARARARRLHAIRLHAPIVLGLARARLAAELGRDPETDCPSVPEYVDWFAAAMGAQLARFSRLRFLHDYHQPEIGRAARPWLYTLGDNNVTLLAEFADLDTGVFVDRYDAEHMDEIFLSRADFAGLSDAFDAAHARDLQAAREVVRMLAFVALHGDPAGMVAALGGFDRAYAEAAEDGR
ncbi:MAG: hypothetical protein JSR21_02460 [Proteobacteria bacterium]|nr:hypothetical protein [Pseudomonadota bacterium]